MKKSIFLFFAAILCAIGMNAATVTSDGTARLYFNKEAMDWWDSDGAKLSAYFYNSSTNKFAGIAKQHSGNTYYVVIPKGSWTNVILTRHNNTTTTPSWDNKWNQTGDLTLSNTSNYISKFENDKTTTTWGTAVKPASTAKVSSAASTIFVGASTTLTPSLTSNADINDIKSTTYTISPTTGASISGNTFTASAEGTYTITATVTYHPDGYSSLTSTATATTTIKAEVPAEETHDVTVSYICGETKLQDPTTVNTVGVETSVKVTAPEIAKYTFDKWSLGADVVTTDDLTSNEINITTKAGGSDFTLVANYEKAKLTYTVTVPAGTENCYLVGAMNGWDEKNPYEMTKQSENVFTVTLEGVEKSQEYKYLSQKGTWDYEEVGGNRTWTANDVVTAWKDPLATGLYLRGSMNGWGTTDHLKKATKEATTATVTIALEANTDYTLKVAKSDWSEQYGTGSFTATATVQLTSNGDNVSLKTTVAGDYVFTWEMSTSKLTVTYPTLYAVTATANDAAMGTIEGVGNYGKGSTATLTATPNDGYLFVNWTKGAEIVATTQEYSFEVTEAVELVANFEAAPEEVHNVTVSYVCGGNKIAEDQTVAAVGVTTIKTAEAPEIFGYTFDSWKLGADVTTDDELTSKVIDINIIAGGSDYTLTANYTEIPKVKIYVVNNKKWSKINVYGWKEGEAQGTPGWPGQEITANLETEKVAGFDVYSYSVVPGSYDNLILNNGSSEQTGTYKWTDGKYYYVGAAENYEGGTAEEVATALAPATKYYIAGTQNLTGFDWKVDGLEIAKDGDVYKHTFSEMNAGTYEFKITDGTWANQWGFSNLAANYVGVEQGKDGEGNPNGNIKIVTEEAKNITVIFDLTNNKITLENWEEIAPTVITYTLMGVNGDWTTGIELTQNPSDENEYMLLNQTITRATDAIKVVTLTNGTATAWCGDVDAYSDAIYENNWDKDGNIELEDGIYNFYFKVSDNKIYIDQTTLLRTGTNKYGTIYIPYTPASVSGATFYQVAGKGTEDGQEGVYLESVDKVEAGKPYIYERTGNLVVKIVFSGDKATNGGAVNGLIGTDTKSTHVPPHNYLLINNAFCKSDGSSKVRGYRAYLDLNAVTGGKPQPMPGRRYIGMSVQGENEATGLDNITNGENTTIKLIENGQLIIIRNGEKFNAQGVRL